MKIPVEEQVNIMNVQLSVFGTLYEKMYYLENFFEVDPEFSEQACDIIKQNMRDELNCQKRFKK